MKTAKVIGVKVRFRNDETGVALLELSNGDIVTMTKKQARQFFELDKSTAALLVGATIEYEPYAKGDKLFSGAVYEPTDDGVILMKNFDLTLPTSVAGLMAGIKAGNPVMC